MSAFQCLMFGAALILADVAARAVIAQATTKHVKELADMTVGAAKGQLMDAYDAGTTDSVTARIGGAKVGKLTVCAGKPKPVITDEGAFMEWCRATGRVETVERFPTPDELRTTDVGGQAVTDDGEVVPGVGYVEGAPYVRITTEKPPVIAAALQAAGVEPMALLESGLR